MLAMMCGHGCAVGTIIALVISTAFLVWLGGKEGVACQKFAKVIAWIAVVLSALLVISSVIMCIGHCKGGGWPCMRGGMMQRMMEKGDMPMGPGMRMGPRMMMEQGTGVPPAEEGK